MEEKEKKGMIVFTKYGPYSAVDIKIENYKGEEYKTPRVVSLCRCGHSANKPFCDGAHSRVEFDNERKEEKKHGPKAYKGAKITVFYDRYLCKHIGKCTHGFPEVFDTGRTPWIIPDQGQDVEKLIEVIKKCPSGALSYSLGDGKRETEYNHEQKIKIEKNGSINIRGGVKLIDDNDSESLLDSREHYSLCRCGASKHKPFCDGSHYDIEFDGQK